ncbi:MAG: MogA/MoaB family molybdenum cofactor biosynthesis protein [Anaerolineae bacterium]|nr:MogA/MoaB family molybdenum cofactor biosynthesis protein [Anaerolineae bacterium]
MTTVGILSISTRAYHGVYEDVSGRLIREMVEAAGWQVGAYEVVPDEMQQIIEFLLDWSDEARFDLVLTTGGTGFAPRDITPEATRVVIGREAPGLAEAMRAAGLAKTPHAMLSRAVCGIREHTLIVNLPGSPKAVRENLEVIMPVLPHAIELLRGSPDAEAGHEFRRHSE